ncbi:MAG: CHRD domain-containing protein [Solirubrobacteraceae bacterium]
MRIRAITVTLLVAAIGAAGCGSSSSSSSSATGSTGGTTSATGSAAPTRVYNVKLGGAKEVPNTSAVGGGTAKITVSGAKNQVCWQFHLTGISHPAASHIHAGAAGVSGPVLIPLGGTFTTTGCASNVPQPEILMIEKAPAKFYVNVHNQKFPNGAARAQL